MILRYTLIFFLAALAFKSSALRSSVAESPSRVAVVYYTAPRLTVNNRSTPFLQVESPSQQPPRIPPGGITRRTTTGQRFVLFWRCLRVAYLTLHEYPRLECSGGGSQQQSSTDPSAPTCCDHSGGRDATENGHGRHHPSCRAC